MYKFERSQNGLKSKHPNPSLNRIISLASVRANVKIYRSIHIKINFRPDDVPLCIAGLEGVFIMSAEIPVKNGKKGNILLEIRLAIALCKRFSLIARNQIFSKKHFDTYHQQRFKIKFDCFDMTLKAEHSLITQLCCRIRRQRDVQCKLSVLQTSALVLMLNFPLHIQRRLKYWPAHWHSV